MLTLTMALFLASPVLMLRLGDTAGSFPRPLKPEEEKRYLELYAAGDQEARNTLIEHNLRLVAHIIKKYYTQADDQDDLISIGTIGLIKGITSYDPSKKVRLATYASRCIENEILMHFRRLKKSAGELSLSETLEADGEAGSLSLADVISAPDDMLDRLDARETGARLMTYMERTLDERETEVLRCRYGLGGQRAMTQRETAQRMGISRSYVSRIEKKALQKLRSVFEKEDG